MADKSLKDSQVLKAPILEQRLASSQRHFIFVHDTVDCFNLCDCLESVYVKYTSCASAACELPNKYMGFAC